MLLSYSCYHSLRKSTSFLNLTEESTDGKIYFLHHGYFVSEKPFVEQLQQDAMYYYNNT